MLTVEERRNEWKNRVPVWTKKTLARHFDDQVEKHAEKILIDTGEQQWTYQQIQNEANRVAKSLLSLGVKKRDHVALLMGNYPEFVIYKLAIAKVGAVCVPMNTMLRTEELEYTLRHSDSSVMIMNDSLGKMNYIEQMMELCPELGNHQIGEDLNPERFPKLRHVICFSPEGKEFNGIISHHQLLKRAEMITEKERIARQEESEVPDDVSDIIYTSGTTGNPKGAMLTHDNFLRCIHASVQIRAYPDGFRIITGLPLYHVFAYVEGFLLSTLIGGTFIPMVQFSPRKTLELIEQTKAQFLLAVPSMMVAILNEPKLKEFDLSSLHGVFCAASNAPASLWERIKDELKITEIATGYGMTEVAASGTMSEPGDPVEVVATTVGRLKPGGAAGLPETDGYACQYKIIDVDTGEDLPPGKEGEIVSRGPQISQGYYKMPEETKAAFTEDGWLKTGDLGILREDGNFVFTGRSKEMYKTSGENVSPKSVEDVISRHPKVNQVHVVGISDSMLGEAGVACIELKEGMEATRSEIIEFCRDKLARFKIPRHVVFMKGNEFPMTSTGKVRKFQLEKLMEERINAKVRS